MGTVKIGGSTIMNSILSMTSTNKQEVDKNLPNYWNDWTQPLWHTADAEKRKGMTNNADNINTDIRVCGEKLCGEKIHWIRGLG